MADDSPIRRSFRRGRDGRPTLKKSASVGDNINPNGDQDPLISDQNPQPDVSPGNLEAHGNEPQHSQSSPGTSTHVPSHETKSGIESIALPSKISKYPTASEETRVDISPSVSEGSIKMIDDSSSSDTENAQEISRKFRLMSISPSPPRTRTPSPSPTRSPSPPRARPPSPPQPAPSTSSPPAHDEASIVDSTIEEKKKQTAKPTTPKRGKSVETEPEASKLKKKSSLIEWHIPCWITPPRRKSMESEVSQRRTSTMRRILNPILRRFSIDTPSNPNVGETATEPSSNLNTAKLSTGSSALSIVRELSSGSPSKHIAGEPSNPIAEEPSTLKPDSPPDVADLVLPRRKQILTGIFHSISGSRRIRRLPPLPRPRERSISPDGKQASDSPKRTFHMKPFEIPDYRIDPEPSLLVQMCSAFGHVDPPIYGQQRRESSSEYETQSSTSGITVINAKLGPSDFTLESLPTISSRVTDYTLLPPLSPSSAISGYDLELQLSTSSEITHPFEPQPSTSTGITHYPFEPQPSTSTGITHYPFEPQPSTSTGITHYPFEPQPSTSTGITHYPFEPQPSTSTGITHYPFEPQPSTSTGITHYPFEPQPSTSTGITHYPFELQVSVLSSTSTYLSESQSTTPSDKSGLSSQPPSSISSGKASYSLEPQVSTSSSASPSVCPTESQQTTTSGSNTSASGSNTTASGSNTTPSGSNTTASGSNTTGQEVTPPQYEPGRIYMGGRLIDPSRIRFGRYVKTPPESPVKPAPIQFPSPKMIQKPPSPLYEEPGEISEIIIPNQETTIEIRLNVEDCNTEEYPNMGLLLLAGSDTDFKGPAAIVYEIYMLGCVARDGRIELGDQIRMVNNRRFTEEMTYWSIRRHILCNKQESITLTIFRPEPTPYYFYEVRLAKKKETRALQLSFKEYQIKEKYPGVYVAELRADTEGYELVRLGDIIVSVDGVEVYSMQDACHEIYQRKKKSVLIKFKRFVMVKREKDEKED